MSYWNIPAIGIQERLFVYIWILKNSVDSILINLSCSKYRYNTNNSTSIDKILTIPIPNYMRNDAAFLASFHHLPIFVTKTFIRQNYTHSPANFVSMQHSFCVGSASFPHVGTGYKWDPWWTQIRVDRHATQTLNFSTPCESLYGHPIIAEQWVVRTQTLPIVSVNRINGEKMSPPGCGVVRDNNTTVNITGEDRLGRTPCCSLPQLALGFPSDTWPLVNTVGCR